MDFAASLKQVVLFKDFPQAEIDKLAACAKEYEIPAGRALFSEGDDASEFFALVMGTVKVLKKDRAGNQEEVALLGTGSYFGEIEFVSGAEERAATIEAQEHCRIIGFRHDKLRALIQEDKDLGFHLYSAMARGLALRLTKTTKDAAYFKAIALRHD
jgi:CRP-like cAMP-binding protein